MRFDDRISTVLALGDTHPSLRAAKWRQLVDLLAQRDERVPPEARAGAFDYLARMRSEITGDTRREVSSSLAGRAVAPDVIAFFAGDSPPIAAPLIGAARLPADEWLALIPRLTPTARALLRHRRDLPAEVTRALASFGASDFAVAGAVQTPAAEEADAGETSQIRQLVARIEAYRRDHAAPAAAPVGRSNEFRWEAGSDGMLSWVDGAPREPLIGVTIAYIAEHGQHGVDGQASGAFEKRSAFRDARLTIPGAGSAAGDWRISGVPIFDRATGSFLGYRGSARRPRLDEVARQSPAPAPDRLFGPEFPADSLRQLIHELRTPLNAIVGFAELIEGEHMGEAPPAYRRRAADILGKANALLTAIDDLDTAARIETRAMAIDDRPTDAAALLGRLHDGYERAARHRGAGLAVGIAGDLPLAKVSAAAAERMIARLLAATIGLAGSGETIRLALGRDEGRAGRMLALTVARPRAIADQPEAALLDPGYSPDGDWPDAPALGLGFSLRLIRNLADSIGGGLEIEPDCFRLLLPPAEQAERSSRNGG